MGSCTLQYKSTIEVYGTSLQNNCHDMCTFQYRMACGTHPVDAEADGESLGSDLSGIHLRQQKARNRACTHGEGHDISASKQKKHNRWKGTCAQGLQLNLPMPQRMQEPPGAARGRQLLLENRTARKTISVLGN